MKYQLITFFVLTVFLDNTYGMTRAQLKKTMTVMKKQCIPKTGVKEDKIANIEQGVFNNEHNVMCYVACVYKVLGVVKKDRVDLDLVMKQVDALYPQEMKEPVKKAVRACAHAQDKYDDMCEAVYNAAKCLYEADPPNFVFP